MSRDNTAYHEAGHAIAATWLGGKIQDVTITPADSYIGRCRYSGIAQAVKPIVLAAGVAAELRYGEIDHIGGFKDLELMHQITRDEQAVELVKLVADELFEVEPLLKALWQLVDELLEHDTLTGDQVRAVLSPVLRRSPRQRTLTQVKSAAQQRFDARKFISTIDLAIVGQSGCIFGVVCSAEDLVI